jgi:hypothetical protein
LLLALEHPVMCGEALPNRQELSRIQQALFLAPASLALVLELFGGEGATALRLNPGPRGIDSVEELLASVVRVIHPPRIPIKLLPVVLLRLHQPLLLATGRQPGEELRGACASGSAKAPRNVVEEAQGVVD